MNRRRGYPQKPSGLPYVMPPRIQEWYEQQPPLVPSGTPLEEAARREGEKGLSPQDRYIRQALTRLVSQLGVLVDVNSLSLGFLSRNVSIGTTPTLIIRPKSTSLAKGVILTNPATSVGVTTTPTVVASAARTVAGNTQASAQGVANFLSMHLFANVSAFTGGPGTLEIFAQAQDPISANWVDTQTLFTFTGTGTQYSSIGAFGVATQFAIRWTISGGTFTFSVAAAMKQGLGGTVAGVERTIFVGNQNVVVGEGFPILEGQTHIFYVRNDADLYGISNTAGINLRVVEMQ